MSVPGWLRAEVEERFGPVRGSRPVGGGCINPAARLEVGGGSIFVKHNEHAAAGMFAREAAGLRTLAGAGSGLRVPGVLAVRDAHDAEEAGRGWLALEWLEPGSPGPGHHERLGRGLAALHRAGVEGGWGWEEDGWIGSLPQSNAPAAGWAEFWAERRLLPQLRRARERAGVPESEAAWEQLLGRLPELLAPAERDGPSLLHGDLWSGNVVAVEGAGPALVDPAVYRGHREVDLAMMELFGGFGDGVYEAYREAYPLLPGYDGVRRGIYQLYYLLVHVNLFGGGYAGQAAGVLRRVLAAS